MNTKPFRSLTNIHPNILLIGSFALAIVIGSFLLHSSFSLQNGSISLIDALFTATSAVCVTGLTVVDTGTSFSTTGQIILLLMVQLGGLGIMAYSTVVILILGKRLSFKGRELVQNTLSHQKNQGLFTLIRNVFVVSTVFELLGFLLLYIRWSSFYPPGQALYQSLFHSVSAFCNAGFSLFPQSLTGFRNDPWINGIIVFLIIAGGLGFPVLQEIRKYSVSKFLHKKRSRLSLHSRIVLVTTGSLIVVGLLAILLLEWHNTLSGDSVGQKLTAALFQSVTSRTAGFNTVNYDLMTNGTLLFTIVLMFIGASPGSCGGGIKTTSLALLLALAYSKWKTRKQTYFFNRTVPEDTVGRSISIILVSLLLVLLGTMALMITELGDVPHPESRGLFMEYLFEAVSAFGTVGLSTGVTSTLSPLGKVAIMILMFIGRLGPITIALAITGDKQEKLFAYPEENIMVG